MKRYDLAVLGSGFAGSLLAAIAARQGLSTVLIERGTHPRFAIGESSTPLSNLLLEELADRYSLPALRPLTKWGTWQRHHPDLGCGIKRGFSFFQHVPGQPEHAMFVAASPHDAIADTHWFREDFDAHLLEVARNAGAQYEDEVQLEAAIEARSADGTLLHGTQRNSAFAVHANFVVDATGPRGALHRLLHLGEAALPGYPQTQALFTHFTGVNALAGSLLAQSSYPPEQAAVHHLLPGGWVWVLHFNNGITSAGVAATDSLAARLRLDEGEPGWQRMLAMVPVLARQFDGARPARAFSYSPRISFRSAAIVGKRWALLPSAAGFVDPMLSTGFPLTLLGVARLAALLCSDDKGAALADYAAKTEAELLQTAALLRALYANLENFAAFRSILLLYFAAASFSEGARRLGRQELAPSFLLESDARFGPASRQLLLRAQQGIPAGETAAFARTVREVIEPFDIAGLTPREGAHDYPCLAEDFLASAHKVNATREEVTAMLARSGFAAG